MKLLSILAEKNPNKIQEKIQSILETFYNEGIDIEERIYYIEPFYYINYDIDIKSIKDYPVNDFINIFKFCISDALYKYIKDYEEPNLIQHIISTDYSYLNLKERGEIYRNSIDLLKEENIEMLLSRYEVFGSKKKITQELTNYLTNNKEINLNGFVLFRMKDYLLELNEIIEKVVEDFFIDREYNEFIKLLKYFVDIQESKFNIVHVVFHEGNRFKIYDEDDELLNNDYITDVAIELAESNINQDDILISVLITIAPNQILIHKESTLKNREIIETLGKIFPEKVHFCNGCKWCNVQVNANKE